MSTHRKLDALIRAAQAAHATYTVYGVDPAALSAAQKDTMLAHSHERTSRIPYTDVFPDAYRVPDNLREFEQGLDSQLARLLNGALDAGNGAAFDAAVEAAVGAAHFDLEIEHSLRENATLLLVMRNRGDSAMAALQLASVQEGLEKARAEYRRCHEAFDRADQRRMNDARRRTQRRAERALARDGRKRARKEVSSHA